MSLELEMRIKKVELMQWARAYILILTSVQKATAMTSHIKYCSMKQDMALIVLAENMLLVVVYSLLTSLELIKADCSHRLSRKRLII